MKKAGVPLTPSCLPRSMSSWIFLPISPLASAASMLFRARPRGSEPSITCGSIRPEKSAS